MTIRILAVGDIHLGRRPRRLPRALEAAVPGPDLTPASAWRQTVDFALERGVDAVLLAGDVVDREEDFFEAYGALEHGVRRLGEAGVPVIGVAGNHDVDVLPRLAAAIPTFRLLGAGGVWEAVQVKSREGRTGGAESVRVVGWSFPAARVSSSPLLAPSADAVVQVSTHPEPTLGLLHCDRDRAHSDHAPVASRDLAAAAVDAWLLGHIHAPDWGALQAPRPSGYLGSLNGLDPTETGPRGPWLVEVSSAEGVRAEQIPLAPLRWEAVTLDCGSGGDRPLQDLPVQEYFEAALPAALAGAFARVGPSFRPRALGCRVTVRGRTNRRAEMMRFLEGTDIGSVFLMEREGSVGFVDRIDLRTEPEVSTAALARTKDPLGLLAAKVQLLDQPADDPQRQALVASARRQLQVLAQRAAYRALADDAQARLDDAAVVAQLRRAAQAGIEALLAQTPAFARKRAVGEPPAPGSTEPGK